jgi:hypothetical protein
MNFSTILLFEIKLLYYNLWFHMHENEYNRNIKQK